MPKRKTLSERAGDACRCSQCSAFVLQLANGKAPNHKMYDEMDAFHKSHNAGATATPVMKRSKAAIAAIAAPPSSVTQESHMFQSIFLEVVVDDMPSNDKLYHKQPLVVNQQVTDAALKISQVMKMSFRPVFGGIYGGTYGEEQFRPVVDSLIAGLISLVGDEKVLATASPVIYYILDVNGNAVEVSPPGIKARSDAELQRSELRHIDDRAKRWKSDDLIHVKIPQVDGSHVWVLRNLIEVKGSQATANDLLQASMNCWKHSVASLQNNKPVGRVYIEVWGLDVFVYGIQDVFGYITVRNGIITPEAFQAYTSMVEKQKNLWGSRGFFEDSFQRCPKTLADFQAVYNDHAASYKSKFLVDLGSMNGVEDYPVGVVYVNTQCYLFPMGGINSDDIHFDDVCARFVQGHVRILASNWAIPADPAKHAAANDKLLQNHLKYFKNAEESRHKRVAVPPTYPEGRRYKTLAEAGLTLDQVPAHLRDQISSQLLGVQGAGADTGETGPSGGGDVLTSLSGTGTGGGASSSRGIDVLANPPPREEVLAWTNLDVRRLVELLCGSRVGPTIDSAAAESRVDGSMLLYMDAAIAKQWCAEVGLRSYEVIRFLRWLENYVK